GSPQRSLSQLLFLEQIYVVDLIQQNAEATTEDIELSNIYLNELYQKVASLDTSRYEVRKHLAVVHRFSDRSVWDNISKSDMLLLETEIAHLIPYTDDTDEMAKRFDLNSYKLQTSILEQLPRQIRIVQNIMDIGQRLLRKRNVPVVAAKEQTLREVCDAEFWEAITLSQVERIRQEIRELVHLLREENNIKPIYTDLQDTLMHEEITEYDIVENFQNLQSYKDRVEAFIRKNKNHLVIDK